MEAINLGESVKELLERVAKLEKQVKDLETTVEENTCLVNQLADEAGIA